MKLLRTNCEFDGVGRHSVWQAPWGKHNPLSWRGKHWAPQFRPPKWQPKLETIFPVVVIKDPLSWMKSMCRNTYEARFKNVPALKDLQRCPSPVDQTRTTVRYQPDPKTFGHYPSLVHLWRDWYEAYLNASFPRLMLRFEDLLFDTEKTVGHACTCVGGTLRKDFKQHEEQTKGKMAGHRGPVNDRNKALRLYADEKERYANYNAQDLAFIYDALKNSPLIDLFHYHFNNSSFPAGQRTRRRRRR